MTSTDLFYVVDRGARLQRSLAGRFSGIVLPSALFAVLDGVLYYLLANRANGFDVVTTWPVLVVFALIPIVVSGGVARLSREKLPLATIAIATVVAFAFAISGLAALRFTLSFSSVVTVATATLAEMLYVAILLAATRHDRVIILNFERAQTLQARLGALASVIYDPKGAPPEADLVLIDVDAHHSADWSRYLLRCYMRGTPVVPWTRYLELQLGRVDVDSFDITDISYSAGQLLYSRVKRGIDVLLVLAAAPIWAPLMAAIAAYVWVFAGSPVVFRQTRRGHGDGDFTLLKFRTMAARADGEPAIDRDTRVVPALAWLRQSRLDELPQLINVLRGEMSLVGPRPESVELAARYERGAPQYLDRRLVLPGITGWAQVNALPSRSVEEALEKLAYDLYYVKYMSPDLDLLVLARTLSTLLHIAPARRQR